MPLVNPIARDPAIPHREVAQVTLSTIGDVSLAVADSVTWDRRRSWPSLLAALLCFGLVYLVSVVTATALGLRSHGTWYALLFPAVCASVFFGLWRSSARRLRSRESQLSASRSALDRLAYEASNATNTIRANLVGYEMERGDDRAEAHLREVRSAVERLCRSMQESASR